MSLSGQLLAAFALYGLPVLFGVVMLGSAGLPVPGVVLVIAAGALVQQGELGLLWAIGLACGAAVAGDNIGYAIGRFGGRRLARRISRRFGAEGQLRHAEALAGKWGGLGIFLSRWLLTPFGAPLNLASGMADYPYLRFLLFDISGEILWAVGYVLLGELLSDRIGTVMDLIGQLPWVVIGLIGAVLTGRSIVRLLCKSRDC
jgi:membrane-associated protein